MTNIRFENTLTKNLVALRNCSLLKVISFLSVTSILCSFLQVSVSNANTIDYGSLEDLFGEPVTVTATGKPQKASEAPVALEIISSEQIRRSGVTTIPEIIGRLPGISSWFSTRSNADVGIRGQNANLNPTLLVMINGRQVYIDSYGYTDWSLLPVQLAEIRQIEVVKGPATALYGFNAVSGVVNIVTYNPKYDNVSEVGVTGGSGNYGSTYAIKIAKISRQFNSEVQQVVELSCLG